jgi:tRNA(Ile)-lysidine synthase
MLQQMKKTIVDNELLAKGDAVVVAVSGGPDSVALLHALAELRSSYELQIAAAHLNHQFRGMDAEEDSLYVQSLCRTLNVPCYAESVDVPRFIKESGLSPEDAARRVRYRFLTKVAKELGRAKVATGHHADDQTETVLMRLIRGTGIEGLAGIPIRRMESGVEIIRPLLEINRHQIEVYCTEHGLEPRHDQSNFSDQYFRNRIRLHWIPRMKEENPRLSAALSQMASIVRDENAYMEEKSREELESIIEEKEANRMVIKQKAFLLSAVALQRRMIKLILSYLSGSNAGEIGYTHIESIRQMIKDPHPSVSLHLPGGLRVQREYKRVIFSSIPDVDSVPAYIHCLQMPGYTYVPEIGRTFHCYYSKRGQEEKLYPGEFAVFDPAQIKGKLYVRQRLAGDRMTLKGMTGSKKVKDIFIDAKVPRVQRDRVPLVSDDESILWIPCIKRSNEALPAGDTEVLLYVVVE